MAILTLPEELRDIVKDLPASTDPHRCGTCPGLLVPTFKGSRYVFECPTCKPSTTP